MCTCIYHPQCQLEREQTMLSSVTLALRGVDIASFPGPVRKILSWFFGQGLGTRLGSTRVWVSEWCYWEGSRAFIESFNIVCPKARIQIFTILNEVHSIGQEPHCLHAWLDCLHACDQMYQVYSPCYCIPTGIKHWDSDTRGGYTALAKLKIFLSS